jgi:hypothetical protein
VIAAWYAARAHRLARELRELRVAYDNLIDRHREALHREQGLQSRVDELELHLECMSLDNADLERVNEALVRGLRWFEGSAS